MKQFLRKIGEGIVPTTESTNNRTYATIKTGLLSLLLLTYSCGDVSEQETITTEAGIENTDDNGKNGERRTPDGKLVDTSDNNSNSSKTPDTYENSGKSNVRDAEPRRAMTNKLTTESRTSSSENLNNETDYGNEYSKFESTAIREMIKIYGKEKGTKYGRFIAKLAYQVTSTDHRKKITPDQFANKLAGDKKGYFFHLNRSGLYTELTELAEIANGSRNGGKRALQTLNTVVYNDKSVSDKGAAIFDAITITFEQHHTH